MNTILITCSICGEKFERTNELYNHLERAHKLRRNEFEYLCAREESCNNIFVKNNFRIPIPYALDLLKVFNEYNKCEKLYIPQAVSFYKMITAVRQYRFGSDSKNFIEHVLPWKLSHINAGNSKELCHVVFRDNSEEAEILYKKYMLSKNPFVGHGKELSPFSKDFNGYKGLSDEEKAKKVLEATQFDRTDRSMTQVGYWTKRGYTEAEAQNIISERQSAFSLEKCIEKFGEVEGKRRFEERQRKWKATLNAKPEEEKLRILKAKIEGGSHSGGYSSEEHDFSSMLVTEEYMNVYIGTYAIADICVGNKIVEFYGDFFHCNPTKYKADFYCGLIKQTAAEIWERDAKRTKRLQQDGYDVKIVWESDYKKNTNKVIEECRSFLKESGIEFKSQIETSKQHIV